MAIEHVSSPIGLIIRQIGNEGSRERDLLGKQGGVGGIQTPQAEKKKKRRETSLGGGTRKNS